MDEAEKTLTIVAKKNKVRDVDVSAMFDVYRQQKNLEKGAEVDKTSISKPTFGDLFRRPNLRTRTIVLLVTR